jgi:ABC-type multidrug transport system fused ATPase/permease subunit
MKSECQTIETEYKLHLTNWPTDGSITFENVTTETSPGALQALDGMSFRIETGEKIGELSLSCILNAACEIRGHDGNYFHLSSNLQILPF